MTVDSLRQSAFNPYSHKQIEEISETTEAIFLHRARTFFSCVISETYFTEQPECSSLLMSSSTMRAGNVSSPNYPYVYPAASLCRIQLMGRGTERVHLKFIDFDLYKENG